ncbi:MAG: helix-turn-helix domain-containing protein [Acidobacteriaceae bacterium]|nr:helix-turn-helix domain-containing protein [Acidobacteriaceae bacterium]
MATDAKYPQADQDPFAQGCYQCRIDSNEVIAAVVRKCNFRALEHDHPEAQMSVVFRGSRVQFISRNCASRPSPSLVNPGSVVYIPSGEPHRTVWDGYAELLNLYWTDETIRELADQSGFCVPKAAPSYCIEMGVQSVAQLLLDDYIWTGQLSPLMVDHARSLIVRRMLRLFSTVKAKTPVGLLSITRLAKAVEAMQSAPEHSFRLIDLARLCNSSVFHFSRSFTARMGCAPFAFQRNVRMLKARELLATTELSVEEVAAAVGISSSNSFARTFRRSTGHSPTEFRHLQAP